LRDQSPPARPFATSRYCGLDQSACRPWRPFTLFGQSLFQVPDHPRYTLPEPPQSGPSSSTPSCGSRYYGFAQWRCRYRTSRATRSVTSPAKAFELIDHTYDGLSNSRISPRTSTVILRDKSPRATASRYLRDIANLCGEIAATSHFTRVGSGPSRFRQRLAPAPAAKLAFGGLPRAAHARQLPRRMSAN